MPVMITLNKIYEASPCTDGWKKVLKAHECLGMDTEFPLSSVLDSNGLEDTFWCFEVLPEYIEIPKRFALWCAREVQHLMTDEKSINALNVAERYLDSDATLEELGDAYLDAYLDAVIGAKIDVVAVRAARAVRAITIDSVISAAIVTSTIVTVTHELKDYNAIRQKQIDKLREMLDEV